MPEEGSKGSLAQPERAELPGEPAPRPDLLRGIRVVDLSMGWAGPPATRQMGDLY